MAFDDVLHKYVGEFGRSQFVIIMLLQILIIPGSFDVMEIIFSQATPSFWPKGINATSYNISHDDPCDCSVEINGTLQDQPCTEWQYDDSVFESTLVTQFDLVCQRAWVPPFASSTYMLSYMAAFPLGLASDRFGRRRCLIICAVLGALSRFLQVFSPSATVFIISRLFVGILHIGQYFSGFVLGTEFVGPSKRLVVGALPFFSWLIGCFLIEGYAYLIRNRVYFELVSTIITACTLPLLWFIPESPRWLCSQGRYQQAYRIMKKMANVNGRDFQESENESLWQYLKVQSEKTNTRESTCYSLKNYVSSRVLVFRVSVLAFSWFVIAMSYFGLTLNSGKLAGNIYLNTFLVTSVELPGFLAVLFTLSTPMGRAISISSAHVLTAIFLLSSVPLAAGTIATTLSLLGKLCISYSFAAIYIYTSELLPTSIRNVGLGFCSFTARIGSVLAPVIVSIFHSHVEGALLLGTLSLVVGLLILCLPETRAAKLPQTISDAEAMSSFLLSKCRPTEKEGSEKNTGEDISCLDQST